MSRRIERLFCFSINLCNDRRPVYVATCHLDIFGHGYTPYLYILPSLNDLEKSHDIISSINYFLDVSINHIDAV
jgi:hypothetical protein